MDYGIDVSRWNNVTDWGAVKSNGISFASVKLTQGDYLSSPSAADQVNGARRAGIAVGGYHFADNKIPVAGNVARFAARGRDLNVFQPGSFLPMLDLENSPNDHIAWNAGSANTFVPAFIHQLRDATSVAPVAIYASLAVWRDILRPDEWADEQVFLWIAVYNGDPGNLRGYSHPRAALHQHTSDGHVPGVAGNVDRNVTLDGFTAQSMIIGQVAPPPPGPAPQPQPTPGGWVDYTIRPGDTLSGVATAHGTTAGELAKVNSIGNPNVIYAGQVIRVPAGGGEASPGRHYRVQPGDTLSQIASRFGVTSQAIAAANGISNPNLIYAGQWLDIPGDAVPTPAPTPPPQQRTYTVKSGDTLSGIAKRLGTTTGRLVEVNGIANPNRIFPGQILRY